MILGFFIMAACFAATAIFVIAMLRDTRRIAGFLLQTSGAIIHGKKTPWALRTEETRQMKAKVLSEEEAIACVREYAKAKGWEFQKPIDIKLQYRKAASNEENRPAKQPVYSMRIGTFRPSPLVEVDAIDGTVLKWQTFPR